MTAMEWPAEATDIVGGDLCAAFAYTTRFGGVSLAPVCPFGIFDGGAGTIETSVPLAFVDKLRRLAEAPEASLSFFRREHGRSATPGHVLAQGDVTFPDAPPDGYLAALHGRWPLYLGSVPEGGLVRRLGGDAYYDRRVPVTLHVRRLSYWPDGDATGTPTVVGDPRPEPPAAQGPPKQGSAPLVKPGKYAKQLMRDNDHLLGYIDGDGRPFVVPFTPRINGDLIEIGRSELPPGGRRAAILGFWYNRELHGQGMFAARGWLESSGDSATFAPSASRKFNISMGAFGQKALGPVALGFMYRKAVKSGGVRDGALVLQG